jgi:His-Xaa-Ser system protein HxsD
VNGNTKIIKLNKSKINEISLRKALYWIDEKCSWELLEEDNHWKINLTGPDDFIEKELSKLNSNINDNILRYNLSRDSHSTREEIIKNALLKIAQDE